MKRVLVFFFIGLTSCINCQSGTKYFLGQNEIIISDSNDLNIESVVNGIDPVFNNKALNITISKLYSERFKKYNSPNIWILPTETKPELIEDKVSEKYEVLLQAKTGDETCDKSLTYNFMVEIDSIPHSLIFNTKTIKNKTYTIYFKSIFGESLKIRDEYFDFIDGLK
ncbi:hypothetical protein [uncultured Zobellia sp.]|uniref:hypothetical protein n=1 Tax=uncultured Zobellia sp. TaxID=255433 RepID=UPI00259A7A9D|nr:hypothetical protein [uncultured Zobellia sp.]